MFKKITRLDNDFRLRTFHGSDFLNGLKIASSAKKYQKYIYKK